MEENKINQQSLQKKQPAKMKSDVQGTKSRSENANKDITKKKDVKSSTSNVSKVRGSKKAIEKKESNLRNNLRVEKSDIDALQIFNKFNAKLNLINKLNAHSCLALDIDNDKITYIKVKKSKQNIQVEKCGILVLDTGMDRFKAIQLTLTNLKSRIHKHGMKVYVSFHSPDTSIRQIVLPKTKKNADLENAIFYRNQTDLSNFNKDSVWNYQILEEFSEDDVKKLRLLVITVPREVIRMHMEILLDVGLGPEKLVPRPLAVATAYNAMVPEPDNDLVVIISTFFTQICYFRNGKLQFFRNAALGVSNIQKAMEEKSDGSLSANNELKKLINGNGEDTDKSHSIKEKLLERVKESKAEENPVIKMLHSEIKRSIEFINGTFPDEKIKRTFISGSGIQTKEIVTYLQEKFNRSIVLLKPQFSSTETDTNRYGEYFTALGTSLQVGKESDIIPTEYKSSQILKNVNILLIALLLLSIGGAASFSSYQKYEQIKLQNTLAQLGQQYQVLNPIQTKYNETVIKYNGVQKEINKLLGFVKKTPEVLEVLRLFSNETPPFIILNEINFDPYVPPRGRQKGDAGIKANYKYRITLAGQIKSDLQMGDVVLINFMNQLNDLNYFEEIKLTNKRKEIDRDLFEFWLQFLL